MRTSKHKPAEQHQSAPTMETPRPPPALEKLRQQAHDIYVAHGGAERMALSDWLKAEQELQRQLKRHLKSETWHHS
jgi:hypothetical protein